MNFVDKVKSDFSLDDEEKKVHDGLKEIAEYVNDIGKQIRDIGTNEAIAAGSRYGSTIKFKKQFLEFSIKESDKIVVEFSDLDQRKYKEQIDLISYKQDESSLKSEKYNRKLNSDLLEEYLKIFNRES